MRDIEIMQHGARRNDGSSGCEARLKKTAPVQHGDSQCSAGVCKSSFEESCSAQAAEAVDSLPRLRKASNGCSKLPGYGTGCDWLLPQTSRWQRPRRPHQVGLLA